MGKFNISIKGYRLVNNSVGWLIFVAILGFLFALYLFTGKRNGAVGYHELVIEGKKELVAEIYGERLRKLRDSVTRLQKAKVGSDSIAMFRQAYNQMILDSLSISNGNADTSLSFLTSNVYVNRELLKKAICDEALEKPGYRSTVEVIITDTSSLLSPIAQITKKKLVIKRDDSKWLVDIFDKNPLYGLWVIFTVGQFTLWCMVLPLLYGQLKHLQRKVAVVEVLIIPLNWFISMLLPLAFIAVFCWILYGVVIDKHVLYDHFFMEGYNSRMIVYAAVGYLAAIGCLGMFLLMSFVLDYLNDDLINQSKTLQTKPALITEYNTLKKGFDNSFFAAAVILSVFVLWIGLTFRAVNETEVMRLYKTYSSRYLLNMDFVYLIGAMHTLILLIFYLPVKIRFNALAISDMAGQVQGLSGNKLLNNFYNSISGILVTASPLLAGILEKLLQGIFE